MPRRCSALPGAVRSKLWNTTADIRSNDREVRSQSSKFGYDGSSCGTPGRFCQRKTRRSAFGNGSGARMIPCTTLNIAVFAPIPERERSNRNEGKPRTPDQHAQRIAEVGSQLVEPSRAPRRPAVLFSRRKIAQFGSRPSYRLFAWRPTAHQILGITLNVEPQLFIHLCIDVRPAYHRAPPRSHPAAQAHSCSGAVPRIDPMTPANSFHFFASASSRRSPAAVRR